MPRKVEVELIHYLANHLLRLDREKTFDQIRDRVGVFHRPFLVPCYYLHLQRITHGNGVGLEP